MKQVVRATLVAAIAFALSVGGQAASAQTTAQPKPAQPSAQPKAGEKTVEEAYLQSSVETMMVKELSHEDNLESKQFALDYARRATDAGRKNDDIRASLQYLALENTDLIARQAGVGPVTNNFPDIRRQACILLGEFPSAESKDTLVRVIRNSKVEDPMVLAEAIRSLGKIGLNDNDEVIQAISDSIGHFDKVGIAEDRLAVYTLFALTDLADKNHGFKDMSTVTSIVMKFTKGNYIKAVQVLARQTLDKLTNFQAQGAKK